jgi:hypothetical protein
MLELEAARPPGIRQPERRRRRRCRSPQFRRPAEQLAGDAVRELRLQRAAAGREHA